MAVERLRSLSSPVATAALLAGLTLLGLSALVEVRIVLVSPPLGDVTGIVRGTIQLAAGIVTLAMGWRTLTARRAGGGAGPSSRDLHIENVERVYLGGRRAEASDRTDGDRPGDDLAATTADDVDAESREGGDSTDRPRPDRTE